ncbi:glycine--tRNA ligase subunit beta [Legionella waltersii]|uniref:Glycine--tRNA ligase beta subunit n=1 Tax=Legionella waltersii TaxID=66969 RepID=A0A0W1A1J4_9GAMM|nr:glycine--tRNA ligase subunit beta [Legionella waltersii]KTD75244.1 glycyl-tRNA synthetase beta chain [Legionella waltersii]SNV06680.1 glycyl-tRNA synthetase subunit beta [Legionella waltersii]
MVNDFIFELGCEELPSGSVWPLADELANHFISALGKAQLSFGEVRRYATPRRLSVVVKELQSQQATQNIVKKGPALIAAYDKEGKPTPALQGFAKSCGVDLGELRQIETDKGDWIVFETVHAGAKTSDLLPELIKGAISSLSIAKPMRWGNGHDEFARPVHWAVMLYGNDIIETSILGVTTGNTSRGHRFHHPEPIVISSASTYEKQLKDAFVIADFSERRQMILDQVQEIASKLEANVVMPDDLVDEVCSIVEWPQALLANFDKEFLDVPSEALIASMQSHQKCFALKDKHGKLLPHFITVSNIASLDPVKVVGGNEKVMRARLSDAAFFFRQDKKLPLSTHIISTKQVVFQVKLGSVYDKTQRIATVMNFLSRNLSIKEDLADRASSLSKCDLLTGMVGEFPELQGIMGYYYALHDGEDKNVAQALNEQYMPRFSGDSLPESNLGKALSLADRIDTLVGIFAIGQKPSGVKDPFKLRRHALAVVRILTSMDTPLNLSTLIKEALDSYGTVLPKEGITMVSELKPFILDRLQSYYQSMGYSVDLVNAVKARQDDCFYDLDKRLNALKSFIAMSEAASLSSACKRVGNLLIQSSKEAEALLEVNESIIEHPAEQGLYEQIKKMTMRTDALYCSGNYTELLKLLASLKEPVDAFFDQVMVMVDNTAVKNNRLALLKQLQSLLSGVADISLLQMV